MKQAFGGLSTDWKEGISCAAVPAWRLGRFTDDGHELLSTYASHEIISVG